MGMEAPRQMNARVTEFLQELAANGTLGPDASANVQSLLSGHSRQMNARVAEALIQAQKDGKFGPDASANVKTLLSDGRYEAQI